jgi:hypothetical protein
MQVVSLWRVELGVQSFTTSFLRCSYAAEGIEESQANNIERATREGKTLSRNFRIGLLGGFFGESLFKMSA